jgi:hypothetical protein
MAEDYRISSMGSGASRAHDVEEVLMDPGTFAAAALMEGVKFLYQQAGEFFSWWRPRQ